MEQLSLFHISFYCSEPPGCICKKCLYYWSSRCECKCNEMGCHGGFFYHSFSCKKYVEYDQGKHTVKECLVAVVDVYQDGYIRCTLVDTMGCEECYRRFLKKAEGGVTP